MKKNIFFVSLVAMMAVSGAYADVASTTYVGQALEGREVTSDKLITVDAYNANKTNIAKYISAPVLDAVVSDAVGGLATTEELGAEQAARETLAGRVDDVEGDIEGILDEDKGILAQANTYTDTKVKALADGAVATNTAEIAVLKAASGADADQALEDAKTYTDDAIAGLDVDATTGDGVVKQIAQQDGKIVPTKAKVANADIADDAEIAQSKISGLSDALAAKIPAPADSVTSSTGTYVLTYTPGTGYAWESIGRE